MQLNNFIRSPMAADAGRGRYSGKSLVESNKAG
jgi:hypothetical protein